MSKYLKEYDDDSCISFEKGELECIAYSYEISSWGCLELNKEETKRLYEAMRRYYEEEPN